MVRSSGYRTGREQLEMDITTELDVKKGLYNIGNQWIASGILEWARKVLYSDVKENVYDVMIKGASAVPHGSRGVKIVPKFYEELKGKPAGQILGLTMDSTRDEIYRAMLEALSLRLKEGTAPSANEILVGAGVWGIGALCFTLMSKVAIAITLGEFRYRPR